MPAARVLFYKEADGSAPTIDWLEKLRPKRAKAKCLALIKLLAMMGHELKRPRTDTLTDGIRDMKKRKTRKTTDGMQIIERRFLNKDKELQKMVAEEFHKLQIGQQIHDLRTEAGLTQAELADLVGTTGSVISRLESAAYDGHSLKMLERIAVALGRKLDVRIVARKQSA